MTTPSARSSAATARKRRAVFDPRLVIGLALVAGAVAGVYAVVTAADTSVQVYVARAALAPGDRITETDLRVASVRLDAATELYLAPGDIPSEGLIVTRSVTPGELVPTQAIGSTDGLRLTSVVLAVTGALASAIDSGSTVDIWAAREGDAGEFGPPSVMVSSATVVRLVETQSIVARGETTAVEVLVPKTRVARVLQAIANDDAISIVPVTLPARG
jgi:hypothetical protein